MKRKPNSLPRGSYVDSEFGVRSDVTAQDRQGYWHNARPAPYYSFFTRLRMAWDVLRYKADALYWSIDLSDGWNGNSREL